MLEMFEKLINEHGSSTILKERIELINDKYQALEEKLDNSMKENELLKKENEILKTQLQQLEAKVQQISVPSDKLPEIQDEILKLLFQTNDGTSEHHLASRLNIDSGTLNYHTDALQEKKLISTPSYIMANAFTGGSGYAEHYISKKGRKYVVEVLNT